VRKVAHENRVVWKVWVSSVATIYWFSEDPGLRLGKVCPNAADAACVVSEETLASDGMGSRLDCDDADADDPECDGGCGCSSTTFTLSSNGLCLWWPLWFVGLGGGVVFDGIAALDATGGLPIH
jgi:hypothetical protein